MQCTLEEQFLQEQMEKYANLITAILDTSIQLRREEQLLSQILAALKCTLDQSPTNNVQEFLPQEFKIKLIKAINNMTNSQVVIILKSFVLHLNTNYPEILESDDLCKDKNIMIMKASVELLVIFFDGICIFENTGTLNIYQEFVKALDDLGKVLATLIDKALRLNHNKIIIVTLLTAISSWCEVQNTLKYYVPRAMIQELQLPISEDHWQQLIQRITNFGEESCKNHMNKLILHKLKTSRNVPNESSIRLSSLIGGIEYFWKHILEYNAEIIQFLNNKEMRKMASLLLADMALNTDNFHHWIEILKKDCLQENRSFVTCILSVTLRKIGDLAATGVTYSITRHIDTKSFIEAETIGSKKLSKIITAMKDDLSLKSDWLEMNDTNHSELQTCLEVLLNIPLMFLSTEIRTITFTVIYAISKEYNQAERIVSLCNQIFSDILEKPGVDVLEHVDCQLLMHQLPQNRVFRKAVEQSFRNDFSYTVLKNLIKSSSHSKEAMHALLESLKNVKSRLTVDQRTILKKAERKLSKLLINTLPRELNTPNDVKTLTLILKVNVSNKKINDDLKTIVESTLHNIFTAKDNINIETKLVLLEEGLQLAIIVLHSHNAFEVSDEIVRGIWRAMFKCPCKELLLPLLASSGPKEIHEVFQRLHIQMIESFSDTKEDTLENILLMWDAILKTHMSSERNKLRLTAINKMIQAVQSVHISEKCWPTLLKLYQCILGTKHLHLPGNIIDMTIFLGLKSLEEANIIACKDVLILCGILIQVRTSLIIDRLPTLLLLYRRALQIVTQASKKIIDKFDEHTFQCLALDIEKLTIALIKLKKDIVRLSPYLIADLLKLYSEASIAPFVKASLQNCISQLISTCDQHGIALLMRTLPVPTQEIFKAQLDAFNKFYKFSGKI